MSHGDAVNRLVALAGQVQVGSYTRKSKTGKIVRVSAYTRDPGKMSNADLVKEYGELKDDPDPKSRNRARQILSEVNIRKQNGEWMKGDDFAPGGGEKAAPAKKAAVKPSSQPASSSGSEKSDSGKPESEAADFSSTSNAALAKKAQAGDKAAIAEVEKRTKAGQWGHSSASAKTQARDKVDKAKGAMQRGRTKSREEFAGNKRAPKAEVTDAEYAERTAKIKAMTLDSSFDKYDTQRQHGIWTTNDDGREVMVAYTPERTEQHRKIIEDVLAEHAGVKAERKALMTGGLGGSGKGTIMSGEHAPINPDEYLTIDPDEMKAELLSRGMGPDIPDLMPMEQANWIHEESSDLANMLHEVAMARGLNVVLDTTMGSDKSVEKKLAKFAEAGYNDIYGVFTDVPVEVSVASALGRHRGGVNRFRAGADKAGSDLGGRYVPPEYIRSAAPEPGSFEEKNGLNSKNRGVFERLRAAGKFSQFEVWDTSVRGKDENGKPIPPRLIYRGKKGDKVDPSQTTAAAMDELQLSAIAVLRAKVRNLTSVTQSGKLSARGGA